MKKDFTRTEVASRIASDFSTDKQHYEHLVLHIPHSSIVVPNNGANPATFDDEEWKLIDLYTDSLFAPDEAHERISPIVFPYCRLYCDVERLPHDPLEKRGLGISFQHTQNGVHTRTWGSRVQALKDYARYHFETTLQLIDLQEKFRHRVLLIDCHSFSAQSNLLVPNPPHDVDICIGFNDDETKPSDDVIAQFRDFFARKGYRVGMNTPFSNSKTFDVPAGNAYHSVMIEVCKSVYMNEETRDKTLGFQRLHNELQTLYNQLLHGTTD